MKPQKVVNKYLGETGLSRAKFADELCEQIDWIDPIKRQTVHAWANGISEPNTDFLIWVLLRYRDWRFEFALECLSAKDPYTWGDNGGIWKLNKRLEKHGHVTAL